MAPNGSTSASASERARAWRDKAHAAVCDLIVPWEQGTVVRASRYPTYYDFNTVRVERPTALSAAELADFADEALAGLEHRRVDFDLVDAAEERRAQFEGAGWRTTQLVWMLHCGERMRTGRSAAVEEVPYDETAQLRLSWHLEDFPEAEYEQYKRGARELALAKGARVLAVREQERLIAFAQLQWDGDSAEINSVYVHPEHRGRGLGTAVTNAAVEAAAGARDLWIVADADERAKDLYATLGFETAWRSAEFLRVL